MTTLEAYLSRLDKIEKLATPGKWEVDAGGYVVTVDPLPPQNIRHEISLQPPLKKRISPYERGDHATPDMELIAAARNALPKLIAIIRAQHRGINEAMHQCSSRTPASECAACITIADVERLASEAAR